MIRIESERMKIEIDPSRLRVKRIEVQNNHNNAGKIVGGFAIANQRWVVRVVKAQIPIALKRWVFLSNAVDASNEFLQAPTRIQIGMLQFLLFGI